MDFEAWFEKEYGCSDYPWWFEEQAERIFQAGREDMKKECIEVIKLNVQYGAQEPTIGEIEKL